MKKSSSHVPLGAEAVPTPRPKAERPVVPPRAAILCPLGGQEGNYVYKTEATLLGHRRRRWCLCCHQKFITHDTVVPGAEPLPPSPAGMPDPEDE